MSNHLPSDLPRQHPTPAPFDASDTSRVAAVDAQRRPVSATAAGAALVEPSAPTPNQPGELSGLHTSLEPYQSQVHDDEEDQFMSQDEDDEDDLPDDDDDNIRQGSGSLDDSLLAELQHDATSLEAYQTQARDLVNQHQFGPAFDVLGIALRLCSADDVNHRQQLLLERSRAYCKYGTFLRQIPATISEHKAIFAPDPMNLAASALKDAEAVLKLVAPTAAEVHVAQGDALALLERWTDAAEAYRLALQYCSSTNSNASSCSAADAKEKIVEKLQQCEREVVGNDGNGGQASGSGQRAARRVSNSNQLSGKPSHPTAAPNEATNTTTKTPTSGGGGSPLMADVSECPLCLKLLYEPVTTPCGHTFCKSCFTQCGDHGTTKCPSCRRVLHISQDLPVTVVLRKLLQAAFPEEYKAREIEEAEASAAAASLADVATIPLFVMSAMLPGERMALNIFEPRYRLMVRRVMEGSRRFGMATVDMSHNLMDVACQVEVCECEQLPDGRFYLEIIGKRRFKPLNPGEQDGYRVAQPEWVEDTVPEVGSQEEQELIEVATQVETMASEWLSRMRTLGATRRGVAELLRRVGDKPASIEREKLSFWIANLLCPLLDDRQQLKLRMLSTTKTVERFQLCGELLRSLQNAQMSGCCVM